MEDYRFLQKEEEPPWPATSSCSVGGKICLIPDQALF
jgi:hypothetical protein